MRFNYFPLVSIVYLFYRFPYYIVDFLRNQGRSAWCTTLPWLEVRLRCRPATVCFTRCAAHSPADSIYNSPQGGTQSQHTTSGRGNRWRATAAPERSVSTRRHADAEEIVCRRGTGEKHLHETSCGCKGNGAPPQQRREVFAEICAESRADAKEFSNGTPPRHQREAFARNTMRTQRKLHAAAVTESGICIEHHVRVQKK